MSVPVLDILDELYDVELGSLLADIDNMPQEERRGNRSKAAPSPLRRNWLNLHRRLRQTIRDAEAWFIGLDSCQETRLMRDLRLARLSGIIGALCLTWERSALVGDSFRGLVVRDLECLPPLLGGDCMSYLKL